MNDHETRLLRELPERVELERWLLQFEAVLGTRQHAERLFAVAETMRAAGGDLNEHCRMLYQAVAIGWIKPEVLIRLLDPADALIEAEIILAVNNNRR